MKGAGFLAYVSTSGRTGVRSHHIPIFTFYTFTSFLFDIVTIWRKIVMAKTGLLGSSNGTPGRGPLTPLMALNSLHNDMCRAGFVHFIFLLGKYYCS